MRLWDYRLIPYLPKLQLISQWRELNSIFKKQDKHILINYIYDYDKTNLAHYTNMVIKEMLKRGYKINSYENYNNYFSKYNRMVYDYTIAKNPFPKHHTNRYLLQCFMNLSEKYFRKQRDFDEQTYNKLYDFVNKELNGILDDINDEL